MVATEATSPLKRLSFCPTTHVFMACVSQRHPCPEKGHAFGTRAKQAASALVFGKDVTLDTHGQDKFRRTLADVYLRDGTNVNHTLVKDGWCWWYRKYAPADTVLEKLARDAREAKKG